MRKVLVIMVLLGLVLQADARSRRHRSYRSQEKQVEEVQKIEPTFTEWHDPAELYRKGIIEYLK